MQNLTNEDLIEKYKSTYDNKIRNLIVEKNLNLVRMIAYNYSQKSSISYEDLFQEGIIALINSIEKYDINFNCKFSTFSYSAIVNQIRRYLSKNKSILTIPLKLQEQINLYEYLKSINKTDDEIMKKLCMDKNKYKNFLIKYQKTKVDIIYDNNDLFNFPASDTSNFVLDKFLRKSFLKELKKILTKREYDVAILRYGFYSDPMKFKDIADTLGVNEKRAQALDLQVRKKLKKYNSVKEYYELIHQK